ncbi:oxidoreductase, short-chain dehydrogenase/reductase family [Aspergillus clavatus NRRL 1]|uniref:Oxidoreductase, short-chain dehydrogenase/reductase family n=1 Tax=Aspergillus clavatus (strain ATCC 1007 / CBS 513.65 / DSM 816 / NCTC 3887 / NRRL 1 / QM 1276 / 107) TaxID=344612 RepID=A1C637_ASPCL|nr:oxidoreductase, short-chain dehydrogenase/reductase family [Aspergillus clavatus NRRL 1]EAW13858.1 oxidoreductase, short-chain dehydrogenase/reductase family [Aspergillus clavatus NRRL 1]
MSGSMPFNPDELPNLSGKVILVTGGTAGLGAATVLHLAKHSPAHIYISGRSAKNAEDVINQVRDSGSQSRLSFLSCDLASLASVKKAAETASWPSHLGHALLIQSCLPLLLQTAAEQPGANPRIIILSSLGFRLHPCDGIIFSDLKTEQNFRAFGGWKRYGQSKLANLLYARELARRYPAITSVSVHPGVVSTGLVENQGWANRALINVTNIGKILKPSEGAYSQLWAATTAKESLENGQFYEPVGVLSSKLDKIARDDALARRLWEWTDEALADYMN